jgi:hypothetical protein
MLLEVSALGKDFMCPVANPCNPSYSGGRDHEDGGSKPVQANSSSNPILKNSITKKKGLVEWLKV